jgi:hypothetical protein
VNELDLIAIYPRLFHLAEDGSWESIERHGLLSTSALLDLHGVAGAERAAIELARRPQSVSIAGQGLQPAVVRDQKPMTASALEKCLTGGVTPRDWFEILNGRVFFWLSKRRVTRLLGARAYRERPQIVLTVDTRSLVDSYRDRIELSPINSGATIYNPAPRGRSTFVPISDYPFDDWAKKRGRDNAVVELVVRGGVPDIRLHVVAVQRFEKDRRQELWRRDGA